MIKSSSLADFNQTTQSLSADLKLLNKKQKIINNPSVAQMRSSPMGTVAPWFSYGNPRIFEGFFFFSSGAQRNPQEGVCPLRCVAGASRVVTRYLHFLK